MCVFPLLNLHHYDWVAGTTFPWFYTIYNSILHSYAVSKLYWLRAISSAFRTWMIDWLMDMHWNQLIIPFRSVQIGSLVYTNVWFRNEKQNKNTHTHICIPDISTKYWSFFSQIYIDYKWKSLTKILSAHQCISDIQFVSLMFHLFAVTCNYFSFVIYCLFVEWNSTLFTFGWLTDWLTPIVPLTNYNQNEKDENKKHSCPNWQLKNTIENCVEWKMANDAQIKWPNLFIRL